MPAFAQLIGRLGQDPTLTYTNGGNPVVNISVASNRQKKDGNGDRVSMVDWFKVTAFGREAEVIAQYATKGSALAFNGRLQTDSYVDREGHQRLSTYLIVDSFEFMPSTKRGEGNNGSDSGVEAEEETPPKQKASSAKPKRKAKVEIDDSDIPF